MTTHELTVEIKGNIRKHLESMTLSEMRRIVAQYCTCGQCKFFVQSDGCDDGHGECLNNDIAGDNDYVTAPYTENVYFRRDFGCIHWQPRKDIEAT